MQERNPDKRPGMAMVVEELKRIKGLNDKLTFKERELSPTERLPTSLVNIVDPGKSMASFRTSSKLERHKDSFYPKK